jgi:MFS family permease
LADTAVTPPVERTRALALVVILLAAFMDLIDVTILNVVRPSIERSLGASPAQVQWMLSGYTLALAVGLISGAWIGDLFGHKRVFVVGVAGFAAASALCGLAVNPGMLTAARVLQGLLAAVMILITGAGIRGDRVHRRHSHGEHRMVRFSLGCAARGFGNGHARSAAGATDLE